MNGKEKEAIKKAFSILVLSPLYLSQAFAKRLIIAKELAGRIIASSGTKVVTED